MPGFDLFVLHSDADVAEAAYANVSPEVAARASARGWPALPNHVQCPPANGSADIVRTCLCSWAGISTLGPRTVLCVPSKAVDAWLAAAVLKSAHHLIGGLECNLNLEAQLAVLPKAARVKKTKREYRTHAKQIADAWPTVRQRCAQAERFSKDVQAVPL